MNVVVAMRFDRNIHVNSRSLLVYHATLDSKELVECHALRESDRRILAFKLRCFVMESNIGAFAMILRIVITSTD